ncbi:hypothetical protein NL676_003412 [Syzygium grande]|nr:hypothetical protein NL676_003412 [Syzygium grande]
MDDAQQQPQPNPYPAHPPPQSAAGAAAAAPFHQLLRQQQQQQLQVFWSYQRQEIEQANDFKNHQLPLARIKKIMKADEDVRMISAEAPILFAKACELFILELTIRSWLHAEENKRRTLQKNDIAAAITRTDIFDFLVDIVPPRRAQGRGRRPRRSHGWVAGERGPLLLPYDGAARRAGDDDRAPRPRPRRRSLRAASSAVAGVAERVADCRARRRRIRQAGGSRWARVLTVNLLW